MASVLCFTLKHWNPSFIFVKFKEKNIFKRRPFYRSLIQEVTLPLCRVSNWIKHFSAWPVLNHCHLALQFVNLSYSFNFPLTRDSMIIQEPAFFLPYFSNVVARREDGWVSRYRLSHVVRPLCSTFSSSPVHCSDHFHSSKSNHTLCVIIP